MAGGRTHRRRNQALGKANSRDFSPASSLGSGSRLGARRSGELALLLAWGPSTQPAKGGSSVSGEAEEAAIAFLKQLDPASQLEVLRRYEEILQVELDTDSRRVRRVAVALHQARRILGRPPSVREYKALRRKNPKRG